MKKSLIILFMLFLLGGCATSNPPRAIYAVAKQDRYADVKASRDFFRAGETPCIKISGYGNSTFSYKLYKVGLLEIVDSGNINKISDNDILTCWKNLPEGSYTFNIYDSSGIYVATIAFGVGK